MSLQTRRELFPERRLPALCPGVQKKTCRPLQFSRSTGRAGTYIDASDPVAARARFSLTNHWRVLFLAGLTSRLHSRFSWTTRKVGTLPHVPHEYGAAPLKRLWTMGTGDITRQEERREIEAAPWPVGSETPCGARWSQDYSRPRLEKSTGGHRGGRSRCVHHFSIVVSSRDGVLAFRQQGIRLARGRACPTQLGRDTTACPLLSALTFPTTPCPVRRLPSLGLVWRPRRCIRTAGRAAPEATGA